MSSWCARDGNIFTSHWPLLIHRLTVLWYTYPNLYSMTCMWRLAEVNGQEVGRKSLNMKQKSWILSIFLCRQVIGTYEVFCYSFLFLYSHYLFVKAFGVLKLTLNILWYVMISKNWSQERGIIRNMLKSCFYPDLCGYWKTSQVPISSKTYLFNVLYEIVQKCIIQRQ